MPFQKGRAKTGGSKRGSVKLFTKTARETCARLNCDPIEGLVHIAKDVKVAIEVRQRAYSDLARYTHPRLNAVQFSGGSGEQLDRIEVVFRKAAPEPQE